MAREVLIGNAGEGKIRNFWVGLVLSVVTAGIYHYFWYYLVNEELKDVGGAHDDRPLADSKPANSLLAITIGGLILFPPLMSMYNYGKRIRRAQRLGGIPTDQQINPTTAFLLVFPGMLLVIPYIVAFWYFTKHQNAALAASELTQAPAPAAAAA